MTGSVKQYAEYKGVRQGTIYNAIRVGRIPISEDRIIDFEKADVQWASTHENIGRGGDVRSAAARAAKAEPKAPAVTVARSQDAAPTLVEVKIEAEQIKIARSRLALAAEQGTLISKALVQKIQFAVGKGVRDAVEQSAVHIAPLVAGKSDLREIEGIIREELRRALIDAAEQAERREFVDDVIQDEFKQSEEDDAEDD